MDNNINEIELSKAILQFKTKYPTITSVDIQTFILGWQAAENFYKTSKSLINKNI